MSAHKNGSANCFRDDGNKHGVQVCGVTGKNSRFGSDDQGGGGMYIH